MWDNIYEFYCPKEDYDEKYHIDLIEAVDSSSKDFNFLIYTINNNFSLLNYNKIIEIIQWLLK